MTSLPAPAPLASAWLLPVASASPPELIACASPATRLAPSPAWMKSLPADASELSARLSVSALARSEEHTSELQSLMRISYAVFCLQKTHKHHPQLLSALPW